MKCPNCNALLMMKRRINNNRLRGLVKIYHCNMCDEPAKTFKPTSGEVPEYFVPYEHKITFCGDCRRLAAVHFRTLEARMPNGRIEQSIITQCEQCCQKTEQEKQPLPIPKVNPPRQRKGFIGPVPYHIYSFE